MARLVVLADDETALGFALAGVEVTPIEDVEAGRRRLRDLLADPTVGLIAASEALLGWLDDPTRRKVESSYRPVVVGLPTAGPVQGFASRRERLAALLRRAIGFHITFPGEEASQT